MHNHMHENYLIINDALLERARQAIGIQDKTALFRAGLEALIAREAGKRSRRSAEASPNYPVSRGLEVPDGPG